MLLLTVQLAGLTILSLLQVIQLEVKYHLILQTMGLLGLRAAHYLVQTSGQTWPTAIADL